MGSIIFLIRGNRCEIRLAAIPADPNRWTANVEVDF